MGILWVEVQNVDELLFFLWPLGLCAPGENRVFVIWLHLFSFVLFA
jgi:hypothetical protein